MSKSLQVLFLFQTLLILLPVYGAAQATLSGSVLSSTGDPLAFASVSVDDGRFGGTTDDAGVYSITVDSYGNYDVTVSFLGYESITQQVTLSDGQAVMLDFQLNPSDQLIDEVVVTGTLKEVNRLDSPVPVEVYNPGFFKKNPTPNVYEALQNVNGVRPQLNCQVCGTGDIQINGLAGPYTMILIDGMPIVSSLATVYGLSGIPNSLIERMEIVKGPASSLYGSEAIGGLINIITKSLQKASTLTADVMGSTWGELNADVGVKQNLGSFASVLTGINYFRFDNVVDNNADNFTDMTLQDRISIFQKWSIHRKDNRLFTIAGRYYNEDRWGGELNWTPAFRGGSEIYGESIRTKRWELLGQYELPTSEHMVASFSFNTHDQNSVYGDVPYIADQKIAFGQLTWDRQVGAHDLLAGTAVRYTYYDDNTPATADANSNRPDQIWLPGIFVQDEIGINQNQKLFLGVRYDYNNAHGNIITPRIAYKLSITPTDILRVNAGTGFRVVNLFTEDHAALTGAREVVITEELNPEQSINVNANYTKKVYLQDGGSGSLDISGWYTRFSNVILPDYDTNPNQIIYDNLEGHAVSTGVSVNGEISLSNGISASIGGTLMDVSTSENGVVERQILTERFTGTWALSYRTPNDRWSIDYTGNVYGPMRLPVLGELDPRPEDSPWWSLQNIQVTHRTGGGIEIYGGVKNLLDWTPWKGQTEPIIARSFDPFDRGVEFGAGGEVIATPSNPNALSFDPSYVFAPNQGIRGFLGVRYQMR